MASVKLQNTLIITFAIFGYLTAAFPSDKTGAATNKPSQKPQKPRTQQQNAPWGRSLERIPPEYKQLYTQSDHQAQSCFNGCGYKGPKACSYFGQFYPNKCILQCMGVKVIRSEICTCTKTCRAKDDGTAETSCNHRGEYITECEHKCYGTPLGLLQEEVCQCMDTNLGTSEDFVCTTDGKDYFYSMQHVIDCDTGIELVKDSTKCDAEDERLGVRYGHKTNATTVKPLQRGESFMDRPVRPSKLKQ